MDSKLIVCLVLLAAGGINQPQKARDEILPATTLHVADAWQVTRGQGTKVGIIDTGFDFFHPALKGRLQPGYYASGVFHQQAVTTIAHGTAIASVVGARRWEDIEGLAPETTMVRVSQGMPEHLLLRLKNLAGSDSPERLQQILSEKRTELQAFLSNWVDHVATSTSDGIAYLIAQNVRVIVIAQYLPLDQFAAYPAARQRIEAAFASAAAHDVLIVLGAGNNDARVIDYPGTRDSVIVAGAAVDGKRWTGSVSFAGAALRQGSNFGPRLTVLAPASGFGIALPHDPAIYALQDGPAGPVHETFAGAARRERNGATSIATAVVGALAALIRTAAPALPASDVIRTIERSSLDVGERGRDDETGHGIVDFGAALALATTRRPTATSGADPE